MTSAVGAIGMPAARVGDDIAHTMARFGMIAGALIGLAAGALLVGATIATGGAALAVTAAVGGAMGLTSFGGLTGMAWGQTKMGPPTGKLTIGSPNVLINFRPATMTFASFAACGHHSGAPVPVATGSSTVMINQGFAAREGETMGCSAIIVAPCSPDVIIGGESIQDPRVEIHPEIPEWAVTTLQVMGIAGAILALPYAIATVGVAATIGGAALGMVGSHYGGQAMEGLARSMGMSEGNVVLMRAAGQFGGGMLGGLAGVRGTQAFNRRYQITTQGLGSNFGNVRITRRPPAPSSNPYNVRFNPKTPGRPDPRWSVDTSRFNPNAPRATSTAGGAIRDQQQFWQAWKGKQPGTLSRGNQYRIDNLGISPKVDNQWIKHYPEHAPWKGQTIEHHHLNSGQYAIPLPRDLHRGAGNYNIWHPGS